MLCFTEIVSATELVEQFASSSVTLPYHQRQKSRLRVTMDNGEDAAIQVARGNVLKNGQILRADNGATLKIQAGIESVSTAYADEPALLVRAAYHLGNRHVAVQLGPNWLSYLSDHVLDEMVDLLGLRVVAEEATFEPESGAYSGAGQAHHYD